MFLAVGNIFCYIKCKRQGNKEAAEGMSVKKKGMYKVQNLWHVVY